MVLVPSDYYKSLKGVESEWRRALRRAAQKDAKKAAKKAKKLGKALGMDVDGGSNAEAVVAAAAKAGANTSKMSM
eukprot:gene5782-23339_t